MNNRHIRSNRSSGFIKSKMLTRVLLLGGVIAVCVIAFFVLLDSAPKTVPQSITPMTDADRTIYQVRELLGVNQSQRAIVLLEKYRETHPKNIRIDLILADVYLQNNMVQQSEELLDEILVVSPNNSDALWLKGTINLALGRNENAWEYLTKAANQPDTTPGILGRYGFLLMQKNRFAEAESYLDRAVDGGSREPEIMYALGRVKFERGKYDQALNYTNQSVKSAPENPEAWMLLSDIQRNVSQNEEALNSLQRARKVSQGLTRGFIDTRLGNMFELNKQWLRAADHYSKAEAFPGLVRKAALDAAKCYYRAGEIAKAMKHIDLVEKLEPANKNVLEWKKKIEDARFGTPKNQTTPDRNFFSVTPEEE